MNNWSISCQYPNCSWIDGVTFTNKLVLLLDSIFKQYDTKIDFAFATDTSIHVQIEWMTVVLPLNDSFLSG
jgi:hypothetical protein